MKKLLIIGAIALVVFGCVLAAGCTSTTNTTGDFAVGTWISDDGRTAIVLTNDFHGVYIDGDDLTDTDIVCKKTAEGKYNFILGDGTEVIWTLDKNKGILTNDAGTVLTKVLIGTSVATTEEMNEKYEQIIDKLEEIEEKVEDREFELEEKLDDKIYELESLKDEIESLKEDIGIEQKILQKVKEDVGKLKQQVEKKIM